MVDPVHVELDDDAIDLAVVAILGEVERHVGKGAEREALVEKVRGNFRSAIGNFRMNMVPNDWVDLRYHIVVKSRFTFDGQKLKFSGVSIGDD